MQVPLERLLLETDAPDGKPRLGQPYKEKLRGLPTQSQGDDDGLNHPVNIRSVQPSTPCSYLPTYCAQTNACWCAIGACITMCIWWCRVLLDFLADIRGEDAESIAEAAFENATKLFNFVTK